MIVFRQKEYSSLSTKLSLGIENTREFLRKQKGKSLRKVAEKDKSEVKRRVASIELNKGKYSSPRSEMQIKRDAIQTRDKVKSSVRHPERIVKKIGKATDSAIQIAIKRPQVAVGAVSGVAIPAAVAMVNPVAGGVTATMPIGTSVSLMPLPKKVNNHLKTAARRYRGTNFSKRLRGKL